MQIGVLRESAPHEHRVSLVPASAKRLVAAGHAVAVEAGAGVSASFPDPEYLSAGATIVGSRATLLSECDVVLGVQRPPAAELAQVRNGAAVVALIQPAAAGEFLGAAAARGVSVLAMELVPRTTKAQTMDVLSSQATVAGYQAVLLGASHCARLLPMLTTAAGTIPPGKAFVLGAGVAGLQAIATARRLAAVVSESDWRTVAKEQFQSRGASFVKDGDAAAEATGGYARERSLDQQARVLAAIGANLPAVDWVITSAAIAGKLSHRL